jgi:hypothetical protein
MEQAKPISSKTNHKHAAYWAALILWLGAAGAGADMLDTSGTGASMPAPAAAGAPNAGGMPGGMRPVLPPAPFKLTVKVDQSYCATGGVQCTTTGHSAAAAGASNHNPVRFGIQILDADGHPVDGLASTALTVFNPFVPAGGPAVTRLDCSDCFQAAGQGL